MPLAVEKQHIIRLYRQLLTSSRNLKYTDKSYYRSRVQDEFRRNQDVSDPTKQERLYKKGMFILNNDLGGLR
ncbi:hypothetical protein BC832DRAFT_589700 [Gaertneriomyces semiglobifer]|nr:hypothetical protein BC832DRAFT_589700 [Gaertneriomyces semiglobifer]